MACAAHAAPGYSVWGTFKYGPGFKHFDYVNPNAPKGGELRMVSGLRVSTFDKYNPYTLKGREPAYLGPMLFESLLTDSFDEVGVAYGLLAEDVEVAPDGLSVTFRLRKEARFHNGDPVTAADVKYSFETLNSKYASPIISGQLVDVAGCDVVDERTVRYRFKRKDRLLPLTVGGLPVFSPKWGMVDGKTKRFDEIVTDIPIGTGPYRIGPMVFGKDITYVRDPGYWARDLPVRRGMANFDRITIRIYRDQTAQLEALKAGEFDLMEFFSAGQWARRVNGKRIDDGDLVKKEFMHRRPDGFQSYVMNLRRPKFQDRRVRMALDLAIDYEWMNRMLFRGAYTRVKGIFGNTDCEANGLPDAKQVALMEPLRASLPPEVFGPMAVPPRTDQGSTLRDNLRKARGLLQQAGWTYRDGALRNGKGEAFTIEFLDTSGGGSKTTVAQWQQALAKLGIEMHIREVDFAIYQERIDAFDFDMLSIAYGGTHLPGQEYVDYFGSKAADAPGSNNYGGIKSAAVDALVTAMTGADNREDWLAACRALDRVMAHEHFFISQWTTRVQRVAYSTWRLEVPPVPPYPPESLTYNTWPMLTWWARMPPITKKP